MGKAISWIYTDRLAGLNNQLPLFAISEHLQ